MTPTTTDADQLREAWDLASAEVRAFAKADPNKGGTPQSCSDEFTAIAFHQEHCRLFAAADEAFQRYYREVIGL